MTGTVEFQNLCISIAYEVKTVLRDSTLSLYQKLVYCFLKIVCVTGFAVGREHPEKRTRPPTLPPPIPTFAASEMRDREEVKAGLTPDSVEDTTNSTDPAPEVTAEFADAAPKIKPEDSSDAAPKEKAEDSAVETPKARTEFQELTSSSADVELRICFCSLQKTTRPASFNVLTKICNPGLVSAEAGTKSFNFCLWNPNLSISEFRPTVAIVAPIFVRTLRQRKEVLELIGSLDNQTFKAAQVILVDDCSPLPWYNSSATGQSEDGLVKFPANTRLVKRSKNHGPASARSLGLGLAMAEHKAQIVNFIDSDCEADIHWVEAMVTGHYYELKKISEGSDGAILSGLTYGYSDTHVDKFHDHFGTLNGRIKINGDGLLYGPSCNISIRITQKLISQVGGFDESFPKAAFEDVDYCLRAAQCGFMTQCVQNAKIWHKYCTSIPQLFRMFQRYGASEWAVLERHPYYFEMYGSSYHIPSQAPKVVT